MEEFKKSLRGVHPQWVTFMRDHGVLRKAFTAFQHARGDGKMSPPPPLVFEAFRYFAPLETAVIVLGQDPYPEGAQGLCFSIGRAAKPKQSLKNVLANLVEQGHSPPPVAQKGEAECGDLRPWAVQRVLLLNAALTTREGAIKAHVKQWKQFTQDLLRGLTRALAKNGTPAVCVLWGRAAESFAPALDPATRVLTWTHPSPLSDNRLPPERKFARHTHFADANAHIKAAGKLPVLWGTRKCSLVFTDGACTGNGSPKARASFAVVFTLGPLRGLEVAGMVLPFEYAFVDPNDPLLGFAPTVAPARPTNNRGEYLAGCWALLLMLRGQVAGRAELVSDSYLFLQTMDEWLPKWRAEGVANTKKNLDIVQIAEVLLARLRSEVVGGREGKRVVLTHTRSHQVEPVSQRGTRAWYIWKGNDMADKLASKVLRDPKATADPKTGLVVFKGVSAWALRGRFGQ